MANETTAIQRATSEIETVLQSCNAMALREMPALTQAVTLATGVTQLRKVLSDDLVKAVFMPLQGSPLGFVTDKDKEGGYGIAVVRDCMIEAMIHGLRPVGNEINIIAGRCYAAKNGYARLVSTWPGLTDLALTPGVPQMVGDKGALLAFRAAWRLNGVQMELVRDLTKRADGTPSDTRIAVRVNSGMGADAVIGKATRKFLKQIYDLLSGSKLTIQDGEAIDTVGEVQSEPAPAPAPPEQDGKRIKMGGNGRKSAADDIAAKYTKPTPHDPETGEVAPDAEPPAREPGDDTDELGHGR